MLSLRVTHTKTIYTSLNTTKRGDEREGGGEGKEENKQNEEEQDIYKHEIYECIRIEIQIRKRGNIK